MKIAIIGPTGMAGRAVYKEALIRGHQVTGFVRNPERAVKLLGKGNFIKKSIYQIASVNLADFDVVINAFANHENPIENFDALAHLLRVARGLKTRFIFLLGAASLERQDGKMLLDSLSELPNNEAWIREPRYGIDELYVLQHDNEGVNWTAISPQQDFLNGPKSEYITGRNNLIYAADGKSHISTGNMATAILNEIEEPRFINQRFTVGDK
ncbi:Rrf2 family transcriptional regulator [Oenococcus oeni]|uniref:NAD(P)H-binding protein n=1 Tax=Oenococcus oeni TaxID=1247 RepID=A0AAJ2P2Y5_OENOE|nr:SDR family oxidoreductase [Oenococcus oeni]KGI03303.1 Rrf2 family transcriptional regulator [Oenococcus oeni IOEB_C52]MDV7687003.1 NAD(P)H-binding protein [Oenococcus oeni]MDV7715154.1 NAD(P)H-binding protein [Oenococcus oeni]OIK57681.1 Rrf2 family transcriptional regulator [Oenococcus oeni]OIK88315.1 Rrf2 family transcriptional regulator [Oenococcus oeni]